MVKCQLTRDKVKELFSVMLTRITNYEEIIGKWKARYDVDMYEEIDIKELYEEILEINKKIVRIFSKYCENKGIDKRIKMSNKG